jgi:hypothetical protein
MIQRHNDGLCRVADVPEHQFAVVVERSCGEEPRNVGAKQLPPMSPTPDLVGIDLRIRDVCQWNFEPTS